MNIEPILDMLWRCLKKSVKKEKFQISKIGK